MSEQREVVILSGVRTAIGDYGGSLKDIAAERACRARRQGSRRRAKIDPKDVGQCVFGNVIHTEPKDMYISRLACVNGGLPHDSGALTLNRLCGSGLQAIVSAAQYVLLGDTDAAVARRRREHEPRRLRVDHAALGRANGRDQVVRHDGRRAHRPVRHGAHGHHRRERRGQVRPVARAAGCIRRREPQARIGGGNGAGTSRARSCRSSSRARRAPSCSIPTSTSARMRRSKGWASSAPYSRRRTAPSPPATRRASTTPPRPSC